jgi:23S rRNA (cytosine1962-C5)-methyltransferase
VNVSQRLTAALTRRAPLAARTDAYRLINRAADGFPDLAVDQFAEVLVAHLYTRGKPTPPPLPLLTELAERARARAVYVKHRPTQASRLSEKDRAALAPPTPLVGDPVEELIVNEHGLRFLIRPGEGLSVGLFLDMREWREWVRARAAAKTVLNCFAYTCGFGVAALASGASRAVNIDISRNYLEWGKRNTELNGFKPDAKDFIVGDVFDWLKRFGRRGQTFDIVILDPPSFSTTRETRFSVQNNYAELVTLAANVTAPGGWLLACANSAELPVRSFKARVQEGLEGVPGRILQTAHEPEIDFPVAPGASPYLKICLVKMARRPSMP